MKRVPSGTRFLFACVTFGTHARSVERTATASSSLAPSGDEARCCLARRASGSYGGFAPLRGSRGACAPMNASARRRGIRGARTELRRALEEDVHGVGGTALPDDMASIAQLVPVTVATPGIQRGQID